MWFQGVEVGTVKELEFVPSGDTAQVRIKFTVNDRVWPLVREDSRVRIQALNLFGEKMMEVTPGSGESQRNLWKNMAHLTPRDEVKFVLADRADYEWACAIITEHALHQRCPVLLGRHIGDSPQLGMNAKRGYA